jgi:hypothetical protein
VCARVTDKHADRGTYGVYGAWTHTAYADMRDVYRAVPCMDARTTRTPRVWMHAPRAHHECTVHTAWMRMCVYAAWMHPPYARMRAPSPCASMHGRSRHGRSIRGSRMRRVRGEETRACRRMRRASRACGRGRHVQGYTRREAGEMRADGACGRLESRPLETSTHSRRPHRVSAPVSSVCRPHASPQTLDADVSSVCGPAGRHSRRLRPSLYVWSV